MCNIRHLSFTLSATCFQGKKFIKLSSYYCNHKTKEKLVLCENSVIFILMRSQCNLC
jgi:hypothetical protein